MALHRNVNDGHDYDYTSISNKTNSSVLYVLPFICKVGRSQNLYQARILFETLVIIEDGIILQPFFELGFFSHFDHFQDQKMSFCVQFFPHSPCWRQSATDLFMIATSKSEENCGTFVTKLSGKATRSLSLLVLSSVR